MRKLIVVLTLLATISAAQADSMQVRLVCAANKSAPADEKLKDIAVKLKKVFGYDQYSQLGESQGALEDGKTLKLSPGEGFTVFVTPQKVEDKTHEMEVELYSGKASVTKATVKIPENQSVFIKGPAVGETLIIIVLTVRQ